MPLHLFSRRLRACVLSWLLMAMAVAMAAPLLQEGPLEWVCSGAGQMKLVQLADEPGQDPMPGASTLDCPNCLLLVPLPDDAGPLRRLASAAAPQDRPERRLHPTLFDQARPPVRGPPENSTQTR